MTVRLNPFKRYTTPAPVTMKRGGLRLYHPTLRNAVLVVPVEKTNPRGADKERRFVIDENGYCLVSEGRWNQLERSRAAGHDHGFVIVNVVENPPAQGLNFADPPPVESHRRTYRLQQQALTELAPAGVAATVVPSRPITFRSTGNG